MSSSISSDSPVTASVMSQLLSEHREVLLAELAKMVASGKVALPSATGTAAPSAPSTPPKKGKKAKDPDAPKKAPNSWIIFSTRVSQVVRDFETASEVPKEEQMKTVVAKQFASHLKTIKEYDQWSDDDILAELSGWTAPEVSKQELEGKSKKAKSAAASIASAAAPADVEADAADAPAAEAAPAPKKRGPMSEEAKAAMAAKKAAKKAAAADAPSADAPAAPVKTIAIKPKTAPAAAPPAPAKKVDLSFFEWTHDGTDYFTNDRGDVVSVEFEWVGRFDGSKIDESAPEPEDLGSATMRS